MSLRCNSTQQATRSGEKKGAGANTVGFSCRQVSARTSSSVRQCPMSNTMALNSSVEMQPLLSVSYLLKMISCIGLRSPGWNCMVQEAIGCGVCKQNEVEQKKSLGSVQKFQFPFTSMRKARFAFSLPPLLLHA